MTQTTQPNPRHIQLLNGWWDFQPAPHEDLTQPIEPAKAPRSGWKKASYLVPGFFTDHPYPEEWRHSRSAWTRTRFSIDDFGLTIESQIQNPQSAIGNRAYLLIKAAIPKAFIFINGKFVAAQEDMFIGDEYDITALLKPGDNELAVFLTEFKTFPHPNTKELCLIDVPWGCCIAQEQAGIWQDVQIEWRPAVHIADVTIRPSTRENSLTIITQVRNANAQPFSGALSHSVVGQDAILPYNEVDLAPGELRTLTQTLPWADYTPWFPENPYLYELESTLVGRVCNPPNPPNPPADGQVNNLPYDSIRSRFGFREVWIEGHRLMLNGRPQRWYGEWCHKSHSHWLRPEYVRQWFQQLKDLNMNYVRMHTFPHPDYFFDIADEMGILLCEESALHGSGQSGWDTPELWPRAEAHVRRIVRRDKNHPSLVIYSVENEMRWSLNIVPGAKDRLPELRKLYNQLDPTRPAYHEGDTSLWNEDDLDIISRHYGPASHGMGWWDKKVPLHSGEMGRWHYASPFHSLQWAGDEVFADYKHLSQSIANDACRIIELARANEVSSIFPWNTSGLDNFRTAEARSFEWEPNTRYAKPLAHKPYESEYAWWQEGTGYRPGYSFDLLRRAFRPLALVIREERNQFYNDRPIPHTVYVVNDLPGTAEGTLQVRLEQAGETLWEEVFPVEANSGCTQTVCATVNPLRLQDPKGLAEIVTTLYTSQGGDEVRRPIHLASAKQRWELVDLPPIAVVGPSAAITWLTNHGVRVVRVADLASLDPKKTPLALIGEHVITPDSEQNRQLRDFVMAGGRALLLEQDYSIFPGLSMSRMPIEMAHVRDPLHPAMSGITSDDLRFFGDDPFGLPSSDAWVTVMPYLKPRDGQLVRPLVDSSGGDFGTGGLQWAPVIETPIGQGTLIASQLRLADKFDALPMADRFLRNTLAYLADFEPLFQTSQVSETCEVCEVSITSANLAFVPGAQPPNEDAEVWADRLAQGHTILVWGLGDDAVSYWERVIGRRIDLFTPEHAVYQLIAPREGGPSPLLGGLSNEDTCWLENWTYTQVNRKERIVDRLIRIDGGITHLHNATRSGLDVLFGDDQATEWKRMPALSHYLDGPRPKLGAGLIEAPVGAGRVIFCQARWMPEWWQFRHLLGLLLWNLGEPAATDVLAGDRTPSAGRQSEGYPAQLRVARVDEAALQEILSLGKRRAESYAANMPFRQWHGWQTVDVIDGQLAAPSGNGAVAIGMEVVCPEPRKFMQTIGGLPNPDLQTFLRLQGGGCVRAWVNSVAWGAPALNPGGATYVTDIDLEAGSNFVVLAWEPDGESATLSLCFQNKDRRAETTFAFA